MLRDCCSSEQRRRLQNTHLKERLDRPTQRLTVAETMAHMEVHNRSGLVRPRLVPSPPLLMPVAHAVRRL